jgi:7-carboxy-7-deazaguanine synthase
MIGTQTLFIRFGGCDYLCNWCDSLYAVKPEEVRRNATFMTAGEIVEKVQELSTTTPWVTLSGGNPALFDLDELVVALGQSGYRIAVETQGTMWKDWLLKCEVITTSPKPPSSGMVTDWDKLRRFYESHNTVLKIVIFDDKDLDYAENVVRRFPGWDLFLQVGNDVGKDDLESLVSKLKWLTNETMKRPSLSHAVVLPQLHVLMWGNKKGV